MSLASRGDETKANTSMCRRGIHNSWRFEEMHGKPRTNKAQSPTAYYICSPGKHASVRAPVGRIRHGLLLGVVTYGSSLWASPAILRLRGDVFAGDTKDDEQTNGTRFFFDRHNGGHASCVQTVDTYPSRSHKTEAKRNVTLIPTSDDVPSPEGEREGISSHRRVELFAVLEKIP